jgi:hypothetical protein
MGEAEPGGIGGDIFPNVKAGIVYPLIVELKHSWNSPRYRQVNGRRRRIVPFPSSAGLIFKHNLCQLMQHSSPIAGVGLRT